MEHMILGLFSAILILSGHQIQDVSSQNFDLTIEPESVQISYRGNARIMCQAAVPLTRCQFRLYHVRASLPLIDLSRGPQTVIPDTQGSSQRLQYKAQYFGSGLGNGQCGVSLTKVNWGRYTVSCRVRDEQGIWRQEMMTMSVANKSTFNMSVTPKSGIVLPGRDFSMKCQTVPATPLTQCYVDLRTSQSTEVFFNDGPQSPATNHHQYFGSGLNGGECGVTILKVTEVDNGPVWCSGQRADQISASRGSILIVAEPPTTPELALTSGDVYSEGDTLTATCTVGGSRPVSTITWLLGNNVLRQDAVDDVPNDEWKWPWDKQTITQKLSVKVTSQFSGKSIVCSAGHDALSQPKQASKAITVRGGSGLSGAPGQSGCPPLFDASLDIVCHNSGVDVNCREPMAAGTTANLKCATGYMYSNYPGYKILRCTPSSKWSKELYKCVPDCGKRNSFGVQLLVAGGVVAQIGEFSWHVGIYRQSSSRQYEQICGGTLITPALIITAAHCFWDESRDKVNDKSLYKVAAGKFYRNYYREEAGSQPRDVEVIHVHERYLGRKKNLAFDIAIVKVAPEIKLSETINVICMDWQNELEDKHLTAGNKGIVAGWGSTSNQVSSEELMSVELPYVPYLTCTDVVSAEFQKFLTQDKLCAGWRNNGTSVCPGDSGGGYVFPQQRDKGIRYYLRGIVSAGHIATSSSTCNTQQLAAFTLVSAYREWIEAYVFDSTSK